MHGHLLVLKYISCLQVELIIHSLLLRLNRCLQLILITALLSAEEQ
jgi:hypothetical protein